MIEEQKKNKIRLNSIDWLRVTAVIMILYDHMGGLRNKEWVLKRVIDGIFTVPLNIIQDFGAFGVSIFFLVSGFLFTYYETYENPVKRRLKGIIKIYLTNISSFLFFAIFNWIINQFHETYWSQFSIKQWLLSGSLIGYFIGSGDVINGTTWFLIPFFLFYLVSIIYALFHDKYGYKSFIIIYFILVGFFFIMHIYNTKISPILVFVFIPISGMVLGEFFRHGSNISIINLIFLQLANWVIMVLCFKYFYYLHYAESLYLVSYTYAFCMLIIFVMMENYFKENKYVKFICDISLSIYLLQMTFGGFLMTVLYDLGVNFSLSFLITCAFILIISWLHHVFIEVKFLKNIIKL